MKLIIVSGLSGAGKTIVLNSLEDMGVCCVDNLPVGLLPAFVKHANNQAYSPEGIAVGVDARTITEHDIPALLQTLRITQIPYQILFLEAEETVLIKRFSETRRKHPLSKQNVSLAEAIKYERKLLKPLAHRADIRINTSNTHVHQLRDIIHRQVDYLDSAQGLSLLFRSFGFKYGIPFDADFVFDVRCLPNPHWENKLRKLTGRDVEIKNFLQKYPKVQQMDEHIIKFLEAWIPEFSDDNRSYLTVAIGCTGGQHRSVYLAEQLAQHFSKQNYHILVRHRELGIQEIKSSKNKTCNSFPDS